MILLYAQVSKSDIFNLSIICLISEVRDAVHWIQAKVPRETDVILHV